MTQSQMNHDWFLVTGLKERVHGLSVDMANVLARGQIDVPNEKDKEGTGFLGTAACKANPELIKGRKEHP